MNTYGVDLMGRRRRRRHSAEFKARVIGADTRSDVAALFAEDAVILAAFKHRVQNGDG